MAKLTIRGEPEYLLSLSRKEVQLLQFILRRIGGNLDDTPRGMVDEILRELEGEVPLVYVYFAEGSIIFK